MFGRSHAFSILPAARPGSSLLPSANDGTCSSRRFLPVLASTLVSALASASLHAEPPVRVPLHSWYSPSRGEFFSTTQSNWAGRLGETRSPDYSWTRLEGYVFRDPQPGTVPLYLWYSPSRQDNYTTTTGEGRPGVTRSPDYAFVRVEGYVFEKPVAGSLPLVSWYNERSADNVITTHPLWDMVADYRFSRVEGYVLPPETGAELGYRDFVPTDRQIRGSRPIFLIIVDFSDHPLAFDEEDIVREVFGPEEPNLLGMYRNASAGAFSFTRGGVARVRLGSSAVALPLYDETILRWAADLGGADFSRFAGADRVLTTDELSVLVVTSNYTPAYRARGQTRQIPTTRVSGIVTSNLQVSFCDEYCDANIKAHFLFHQLGPHQEIIGPNGALNYSASFLAGGNLSDPARPTVLPFLLDPWHRMVAGWMVPQVVRLSDAALSTVITTSASRGPGAPILVYDPSRTDRTDQFFLIEYRNPGGGGVNYDAGVRGQGVAVWLIERDADGDLAEFTWPPPGHRGPSGPMVANYLVGPSGVGSVPFWREADGEAALRWFDDSDSGIRLRVGPLEWAQSAARIQLRKQGRPFVPRIDRVTPEEVRAGGRLVVEGSFPTSAEETVLSLHQGGNYWRLTTREHDVTRVIVDVGTDMPAGSYLLHVTSIQGSPSESNGYEVRVDAAPSQPAFRRGDANGDGSVDISDGRRILDFLFAGDDLDRLDAADADDNGAIELTDAVRIFGYLFLGNGTIIGIDRCGPDPTRDLLGCEFQAPCR